MELDTVEQGQKVLGPAECEVQSEDADTSTVVEWAQVNEHAKQALLRATVLVAGGTAQVAGIVARMATRVQSEACRRLGPPS